ncbi:hypothetical protein FQR65_LT05802 [Abscondita terminalis]|nr:hypothetical protein FQR65_LT05802 [Abscondita terminalis]
MHRFSRLSKISLIQSNENKNYCNQLLKKGMEGKVAVINGATQGIGFAIAKKLAEEGAKVIISSRKQKNVNEAVDKLAAEGLKVTGFACHVSDKEARKVLLDKAAQLGGIDALILNAGINPVPRSIMEADEILWDKIFDINLKSQFFFAKDAIPLIKKHQQGTIIFMSTIAVYAFYTKLGLYSVSKIGLHSLVKTLSSELANDNITVNCVVPGPIDTKFAHYVFSDEDVRERIGLLKRYGTPEEVAALVAFLASKYGRFITGTAIPLSGGKVAVVSGGTQGIGFSIAKRLAQEGAKVIISSRKQANVNEAIDKLAANGLNVTGVACHVAKKEERKIVLEKAAQLGGIDTLILNAGVNPIYSPIIETEETVWDKVFDTNIKAQFFFVKEAMPLIKKRQEGSIIFTSTIAAYTYVKNMGVYAVSKTCLLSLTKVLSRELASDNITVNCIAPGVIETKFAHHVSKDKNLIHELIPLRRSGKPDEVAAIVTFLASKDARFITGETIVISGGMHSRL